MFAWLKIRLLTGVNQVSKISKPGKQKMEKKMEIPLDAKVECSDGVTNHLIGHSVYVLINPITDQITHLVVEEENSPNEEYIVSLDVVAETTVDTVRLTCSFEELKKMPLFIQSEFVNDKVLNYAGYGGGITRKGSCYYMPFVTSEVRVPVYATRQQIPPGELAVHRGTHVEAKDGYIGKVDEFVVNPDNGHITHLVMRSGHLWDKKEIVIPISALEETRENTVFLNLDKNQVESLPTFQIHRHPAL